MHDSTSILTQTTTMTPAEFHRTETASEQIDNGTTPRTPDQDRRRQLERKIDRLDQAAAADRPALTAESGKDPSLKGSADRADRMLAGERRPPGESSEAEKEDARPRGGAPPTSRESSARGEPSHVARPATGTDRADGATRAVTEQPRVPDTRVAARWSAREAPTTLAGDHPLLRPTIEDNSPERLTRRREIIDDLLVGVQPPDRRQPALYLLGGGGGSGKSHLAKELTREDFLPTENVVRLDPDDVKNRLPEFAMITKLRDPRAARVVHEESSAITRQAFTEALEGGVDIILDSVLADVGKGITRIEDAHACGYRVRLIGTSADVETAMDRVLARGEQTGRHVPPDQVLAAHRGFALAFPEYAKRVDSAVLFDTNGDHRIIATKNHGGELEILDPVGYRDFLRKQDINLKATGPADLYAEPPSPAAAPSDGPSRRS